MANIEFTTGDLLTANVEALVNTVNCVGAMGRGIALQFKRHFPENYKLYAAACKREEVQPGRMFITELSGIGMPRYIINFPTKRHWRGKSRLSDIEAGLIALAEELQARDIHSVALPPLGAGLGGLEWPEVRALIVNKLDHLKGIRIVVYEPLEAADIPVYVTKSPKMTAGRAALVELIARYLSGLMDTSVSLLEVQKLMYFLQQSGEPLRLRYTRGTYGPYADNLRQVLKYVDGHFISGYGDGGEEPDKLLSLVPGARQDARAFLQHQADTLERLERVSELIEGFETPYGMELLATVHCVLTEAGTVQQPDLAWVTQQIHAWNEHKRQFTPEQIEIAWRSLARGGWLPAAQQPS